METLFTNYRFKIEFSQDSPYNNVYGIITTDSDGDIGIPPGKDQYGGIRIDDLKTGIIDETDLMIYDGNKFCGFTPDTVCVLTSDNGSSIIQHSRNANGIAMDKNLNIMFGGSSNGHGSLLHKNFLTPNMGIDNWFITTHFDHENVEIVYALDIYSVIGSGESARATRLNERFTMTVESNLDVDPYYFIEGTKIYSSIRNKYVYVEIQNLRPGNIIKTRLHGDRYIKFIGKGSVKNSKDKSCIRCIRKKLNNRILEDVYIKWNCNISDSEPEKINGYEQISINSLFNNLESINDNKEYTYYHIVLENDGDQSAQYEIWTNGILSDTQSERDFITEEYDIKYQPKNHASMNIDFLNPVKSENLIEHKESVYKFYQFNPRERRMANFMKLH